MMILQVRLMVCLILNVATGIIMAYVPCNVSETEDATESDLLSERVSEIEYICT